MSEARAAITPKTNVAVAGVPVTFHISESHLKKSLQSYDSIVLVLKNEYDSNILYINILLKV